MKRILFYFLCFTVGMVPMQTGCKSKKKAKTENAAEAKAAAIENAKNQLRAIIDGTDNRTLTERWNTFNQIKAKGYTDAELNQLLIKAEQVLMEEQKKLEAEQAKAAAAAKQAKQKKQKSERLLQYFEQIANAATREQANQIINNALQLFQDEKVPVLIIIHMTEDLKDYDRPTTALRYLNYVKDTKQYESKVESIELNEQGKITQIELLK